MPPKCFKKLYPIFLDTELNRNKLEINKWEIEINKLIEYKYKNKYIDSRYNKSNLNRKIIV